MTDQTEFTHDEVSETLAGAEAIDKREKAEGALGLDDPPTPAETKALTKQKAAAIAFEGGKLAPADHRAAFVLADAFWKSGIRPGGAKGPADVWAVLTTGLEAGLTASQAIQGIMVIKGRTAIWGDVAHGLVLACPDYAGETVTYEGEGEDRVCNVTMTRMRPRDSNLDAGILVARTFSMADAKRAGLAGKDTYKQYPDRMLYVRARAFCQRDLFADVLHGFHIAEELIDPAEAPRAEVVVDGVATDPALGAAIGGAS